MLSTQLKTAAQCLFAACALSAVLDVLVEEEGTGLSFRMLCGVSVTLCAVRLTAGLLAAL
ncbi:MAG: hypothetical protein Q4C10_07720 [Clostridia bacterium]|nr:hypothetical protein [Clostridia bacterium]